MDNFVDSRDYGLLQGDKYTFSVLSRIIGGPCRLMLTDHESLILCFTGEPFPVWIWNEDDASKEDLERAYRLARDNGLMDGRHRFNMKYSLAEYFLQRAKEDGLDMSIETNMFAYDCPEPIQPTDPVEGELHVCTAEDLDVLVDFYDLFHDELDADRQIREEYRIKAEEGVKYGTLYLWKNSAGEYTTSCSWHPVQDMASIGLVYTREEFRRKHYAENLVYHVTRIVKEIGLVPMLYTDADYAASNACYEKIGYILRGKLCTIS